MDYSKTDYAKLWHEQCKRLATLEAAAKAVLNDIEQYCGQVATGNVDALRNALGPQDQ